MTMHPATDDRKDFTHRGEIRSLGLLPPRNPEQWTRAATQRNVQRIQLHTVKLQKKQTPPTEQLHRDFTTHAIPRYKESNKLNVIIGVNGLRSELLWCRLLLPCVPAWAELPARRRAAPGRVGVAERTAPVPCRNLLLGLLLTRPWVGP